MYDGYRFTGRFPGESEGWGDDSGSRSQLPFKFRKERIEDTGEEVGIENTRLRIIDRKEILFQESDGFRMPVAEEIPPCEAVGDDVFLDTDVARPWFPSVAFDKYPSVTTTEIVDDAFRLEGDGVDHFFSNMLFRGYKRGFTEEHAEELEGDGSDDDREEESDEEEDDENDDGHDVLFVGVPGIEPGSHAPEACVIPLYNTPFAIPPNGFSLSSHLLPPVFPQFFLWRDRGACRGHDASVFSHDQGVSPSYFPLDLR